jgi:polysaccharide chain length determinant protein (PEP-CTERM system associated)
VPGTAAGQGDTASRIRETQARLDELLLNFTDKHPDVIAARQTLAELNARRASELQALQRGDVSAFTSGGATANPVYQSIQLALNQADVEIASLRRQLGDHQSRVADLRRALDTMPKVEAQYAQLNRDYDVNKTQYTALLTQLEKAKLGQEADTSGSVRFEIVEPPNAEYHPVAPHRSLLVLAVLAVSVGIGAGLAYLIQLLQPVYWSVRSLAEATGATVLGAVSPAFPQALLQGRRRDLSLYTMFAGGFLLLAAVVLGLSLLGEHLTLSPHTGNMQ